MKLYLVFEFMKMDLKKYIDREEVHPMLVKVWWCVHLLYCDKTFQNYLDFYPELHIPDSSRHSVHAHASRYPSRFEATEPAD